MASAISVRSGYQKIIELNCTGLKNKEAKRHA
jgi:hypothetical protein